MKILQVSLKNFRGVKEGTLDFLQDKPFILLGPNGSCKSSYGVYSVPFCFWGYSPWKLEDVLTWGSQKGYVETVFEVKGKRYVAKRIFDNKSSKFRVYSEGSDNDLGGGDNAQNEDFFAKLFPVPKEVALQIMFKLQSNALGSFCSATSTGKYNIIKDFIGIEKYVKYRKYTLNEIKGLNKDYNQLEGKIKSSKDLLEGVEYTNVQPKINKLKKLKGEKEELNGLIDKAKIQNKAIEDYNKAKKFISNYPDIKEWYDKWQPLKTVEEPKLKWNEETFGQKQKELKKYKKELPLLEVKVEEKSQEVTKIEVVVEKEDDDYKKIHDEINDLRKQKKLLSNDKCPTCERRFNNTDDRIDQINQEIGKINKKIIKPDYGKLKKVNEEIKGLISKTKDHKKKVNEIEKWLLGTQNNKKATELWNEKKDFQRDYPYEKSPDDLYRGFLNAKEIPKPKIDKELNLESLLESKIEAEDLYDSLNRGVTKLQEQNKIHKVHTSIVGESEEKMLSLKEDLQKYKALSAIYSKTGLPHFMIGDFLNNLQLHSNKYLSEFTNNRFAIEFKTTLEGRDNIEMVLYDSERGNKPRPYSTLSGGEKMRVAVCVEVLGMKKTYSMLNGVKIDSCIIDEVPWIDENGQKAYAKVMERMISETSVVCGVVCFESMGNYFENIRRVKDGKIIS